MDAKLEVVRVPVADIDRAKRFYAEGLGFAVDLDHQIAPEMRLVQLTPLGSGCSIHLSTENLGMAPGSLKALQLVVDDIEAAHGELVGRGLDVSEIHHYEGIEQQPGRGGPWNSFVTFDDPDGNSWVIQERP
jgi:catechol 2,3-dioxygenase-like lactoylglutathione lyase family enzyme